MQDKGQFCGQCGQHFSSEYTACPRCHSTTGTVYVAPVGTPSQITPDVLQTIMTPPRQEQSVQQLVASLPRNIILLCSGIGIVCLILGIVIGHLIPPGKESVPQT